MVDPVTQLIELGRVRRRGVRDPGSPGSPAPWTVPFASPWSEYGAQFSVCEAVFGLRIWGDRAESVDIVNTL